MNGHENGLLQEISRKLDKLDDTVRETNDKIAKANENIATTKADVKNLVGWSQQMEHRFESLEKGGCPQGKVLEERVNNLNSAQDKEITEIKSELKKKATKAEASKISGSVGAASGTILSAVIHALFAYFK